MAEISVSPPLTLPLIFTVADAWAACRFNREALSALAWLRSMVLLFSALITTLPRPSPELTVPFTSTLETPSRDMLPSALFFKVTVGNVCPLSPKLVMEPNSTALCSKLLSPVVIVPAMSLAAVATLIFPSTEILPLLLAGTSATRFSSSLPCARNLVISAFLSKILVVLLLEPSLLELMDFMIFFM